jgi:hypothetical protein
MTRPRKTILRRKDKVYKRIKALKSILRSIVLLYTIILLIIFRVQIRYFIGFILHYLTGL